MTASASQNRGRPSWPRPAGERVCAARRKFYRAGDTVRAWAARNGYDAEVAYKVLSGRRACTTGESHRIAVALGIKDGEPMAEAAE